MAKVHAVLANGWFLIRAFRDSGVKGADIRARFPEALPAIDYRTYDGDGIAQSKISFEDARKYNMQDGDIFEL